jgi:hypothetical protein
MVRVKPPLPPKFIGTLAVHHWASNSDRVPG